MAATTTSNPDKSSQQQIFMDANYFEALKRSLVYFGYGTERTVPGQAGHRSVRYYRPRKARTTDINRKTSAGITGNYAEGVVPTTQAEVALGYVDAFLNQTIWYATISDEEMATGLINALKLYTAQAGMDDSMDLDQICANCLIANPAVAGNHVDSRQISIYNSDAIYAGYFERFSGRDNSGDSSDDFTAFDALTPSQACMTRAFNLGCMTQLRTAQVPKINGRYPVIADPRIIDDVRGDSTWIQFAAFNADKLALFKGGEFELDGGVFIESTNSYREASVYGTRNDAGPNFAVTYLGADAFVRPKLSNGKAGGPGNAPLMFLTEGADHANPAAQYASLASKTYYGAAAIITNEASDVPHYVVGRVKSKFVSNA